MRLGRIPAPLGALAAFAAQKILGLAVLGLIAGTSVFAVLFNWDGYWYADVVDNGYSWPGTVVADTGTLSNLAFFPLYPLAAKALTLVGFGTNQALFVVAWVATIAAAFGIYQVGKLLGGQAVGLVLVLLWGAAPRSLVELMPYSEPLFTALVALAVWGVLKDYDSEEPQRWLVIGLATGLAGLTRPSALPLIATLWLVWLVWLLRDRRRGLPWRAATNWRWLGAAALGSTGFVAVWVYVGVKVGSFWGYLMLQAQWGSALANPLAILLELLGLGSEPLSFTIIPLLVMLCYTALFGWWPFQDKRHWPLVLFSGLSLLLVWSQAGYLHSKARFLLPAFPLWLPLARWICTRTSGLRIGLLAFLALGMAMADAGLSQTSLAP